MLLQCDSRKELWLEGEAALQLQSFRDAEPHLVIPLNAKKNMGCIPNITD